ncbi:MAG: NAD-dependent epimerase/dehydratase family protein [Pikeienuella sp.]
MGPAASWAEELRRDRTVLVTGVAGFIGFHLADRLLAAGLPVVGVDALNAYYDPALKQARLARLTGRPGFAFRHLDLADRTATARVFAETDPAYVLHMAAQAGVRYSIDHPMAYADANLTGFLTVLEGCRAAGTAHLVYASSSSVYGGNTRLPFSVADTVDHPVSLYAATKKAGELMAHTYSHLYGLPATGLRFFTVYGPWGRPDMAVYKFTEAIYERRPIRLFAGGVLERDFTYIDDIVEGVLRLLPRPPAPDPDFDRAAPEPGSSWAPHRIYNIGNHKRETVLTLVALLEKHIGQAAIREDAPMQPGDVAATWADTGPLAAAVGFAPDTPLDTGLARFVDWYRTYRGIG